MHKAEKILKDFYHYIHHCIGKVYLRKVAAFGCSDEAMMQFHLGLFEQLFRHSST